MALKSRNNDFVTQIMVVEIRHIRLIKPCKAAQLIEKPGTNVEATSA